MFDWKHYVPILKGKRGEFTALQQLDAKSRTLITPLIEIASVDWDYDEDEPAKSIDEHLENVGERVVNAWGSGNVLFVDANLIDPSSRMMDGSHYVSHIFEQFRARQVKAIPVSGLDRDQDYQVAVAGVAATDKRGICIRLVDSDFANADLGVLLDKLVVDFGLRKSEVDLILDFREIKHEQVNIYRSGITQIVSNFHMVAAWRSFTIAGTGFPLYLGDIQPSTVQQVPRTEWLIWRHVVSQHLLRKPTLGDYGISNPELVEMDPRVMRVSANIRYTAEEEWIIFKGEWLRRPGGTGFQQFHDLSRQVIAHPAYKGNGFSWGDSLISNCANGNWGPGNLTDWRAIGTNHHLVLVSNQISSLP